MREDRGDVSSHGKKEGGKADATDGRGRERREGEGRTNGVGRHDLSDGSSKRQVEDGSHEPAPVEKEQEKANLSLKKGGGQVWATATPWEGREGSVG